MSRYSAFPLCVTGGPNPSFVAYRVPSSRVHFLDNARAATFGELFICAKDLFVEATASPQTWGRWLIQDRFAANPEKAHTRDAPRTSTASGTPNAMVAHHPRVAQGLGAKSSGLSRTKPSGSVSIIVLFIAVAVCLSGA